MKMVQKIIFLYLVAILFYLWGCLTIVYQIFPYSLLKPTHEIITSAIQDRKDRGGTIFDTLLLKPQEAHNNYGREGFIRVDSNFHDEGFLLISRYSRPHSQVIIELFSIHKEEVLHTWVPDIAEVLRQTPKHQTELNNLLDHRVQHPLLLSNGDLIIKNSEGPMARIRPDGSVVWALDYHFHHSLELDKEGHIVVPINLVPPDYKLNPEIYQFRDDGIALVSQDGSILETYSLMELFLKKGRRDLVFGIGPWEPDRFHLNDCKPIFNDIGEARRGDIALSIRNLSTIALFRPSENRLVWVETGPWLSQHDINSLDDGRYSVFGNDVVRFVDRGQEYINDSGHAEVYLFTPATREVETPWSNILKASKVRSKTQGRARVLDNGDVVVEATDTHRILRLSPEAVRWEYISISTPGVLGALHWSRYLKQEEVDLTFLAAKESYMHNPTFTAQPMVAYIGPGIGAGIFAVLGGILLSLVMAIVALFWYPIKMSLQKVQKPIQFNE